VTLVVPAVLGGLALAVMALVSLASARRHRAHVLRQQQAAQSVRILIHSINDDRCTGCDACVAVCPTNVLDLVENKSRVLRFGDCIQCEACMWACPTTALVMHPEGTEPPRYRMPDLDESYQTRVPGQYLIGEVAGKPLVKNAANLGRGVVEHMLATGLRPLGRRGGDMVDVAIVGSGPGGLSAALTCIQRGLSYVVLEKDNLIASTIARYPKGKLIMAEPYDTANLSLLPVFDSSKEEIIPIWKDLIGKVGLQIRMNEAVERVVRGQDGTFEVRTNVGGYRAQRVVLATGLRGKPRTLGVPGENLPKVSSLLEDPDLHRGQTVCVVGGGDSALEAAIALADSGAKVVLSYRGRAFSRAQPKNRQTIESYEAQRRIKVKYQSEVVEFGEDTVTLQMADGTQKRYPNQAAFVLIGADPPIDWLATMGIHFVERPHMFALPRSDEFVRQLVGPSVRQCPESAASAAALVLGQELPEEPSVRAPAAEPSRPRKWLRSASKVFTTSGKLDRPMPLSEFAQQARRHSGHGRRDKLDPRERTRVLRMLRDEGGRRADEDSKVVLLDREGTAATSIHRADGRSHHAPSRRGRRSSPPPLPPPHPGDRQQRFLGPHMPTVQESFPLGPNDDPLRTIPPDRGDSPKPAVIVGLAKAAAQGPRSGARRKRESSRPPIAREPFMEEPTRQLGEEQARALLERLEGGGGPRSPEEMPTDYQPIPPSLMRGDDEATRQVNLGEVDDLAVGSDPTGRARARRSAPPPPSSRTRRPEEPTRAVDLGRHGTLSNVDWDLD